MAHSLTIPVNENGVIFDPAMDQVISAANSVYPFGFDDVYLFSHGWSTNTYAALDEYNLFSTDLARQILIMGAVDPCPFVRPPRNALTIGVHWPSEITEDPSSPLNSLQLLTFYTMEHRADAVGKNAVYMILRLLLKARMGSGRSQRFFLLGHSFGCKVICAALQDLQLDIASKTVGVESGTEFRIILLQGATDNDNLQNGDIYGAVHQITNLRLLVTKSSGDLALNKWYADAGKLANLLHAPPQALGASGPTPETLNDFGGSESLSVTSSFLSSDVACLRARLIVADLSPIHAERKASGAYNGGASGSHSDINFDQVQYLVSGFFFS